MFPNFAVYSIRTKGEDNKKEKLVVQQQCAAKEFDEHSKPKDSSDL
jgi:hypothetical protein